MKIARRTETVRKYRGEEYEMQHYGVRSRLSAPKYENMHAHARRVNASHHPRDWKRHIGTYRIRQIKLPRAITELFPQHESHFSHPSTELLLYFTCETYQSYLRLHVTTEQTEKGCLRYVKIACKKNGAPLTPPSPQSLLTALGIYIHAPAPISLPFTLRNKKRGDNAC